MKKYILSCALPGALALCGADVTISQLDFDSTPEARKRYFSQPHSWWGQGKYPVKNNDFGKIITLTNSRTRYVFFFYGKKNAKGEWFPAIGQLRPSKANWATGGFISFKSGRISSQKCAVTVTDVNKGGFTVNYKAPGYSARCRMELKKDDDRLYMLFDSPQMTEVRLTVYPSSYAGSYSKGKHLRKRYGVTPLRRLAMGGKAYQLGKKEHYILLGDSYFDPGANRGEGPCALICNPALTQCSVGVNNYGCSILLKGKGAMPFVLFDFNGTSNAEAERIMKELPVKFH